MMKLISNGLLALTAVVMVATLVIGALPVAAHAQADGNTGGTAGSTGGGTGGSSATASPATNTIDTPEKVKGVLEKITNWMFTIFIALAAAMIIYAAFVYLTSGGGEDVSKAHKMLLYAAVAVAVATASRGLVALTRNFISTP